MSALSAIEDPVAARPLGSDGVSRDGRTTRRPLVVVPSAPGPAAKGAAAQPAASAEPRACSIPPRSAQQSATAPLRLTRRGRVVVAALLIAALTVVVLVITLAASGGAEATNHGQARGGYQGMHQIVVQPGQTLWSIASAAEPSADPRAVVQEIMTANGMTNSTISIGQLLWVPR